VTLFVAGIPVIGAEMLTICDGPTCYRWQPTSQLATELAGLGMPLAINAVYKIGLEALFVLCWCVIATVLVWRRSREPMALFAAFMLVTFGGVTYTDTIRALVSSSPLWWWPRTILACFGWASLFVFFYLFPDGRFVPRWTRLAAFGSSTLIVLSYFSPAEWGFNADDNGIGSEPSGGALFGLGVLASFASVVVAQAYRYWRVSTPVQRQQSKWVICGFVGAYGTFLVLFSFVLPALLQSSSAVIGQFVGLLLFGGVLLLIPLSIAAAILRHQLYDIDLLISRGLVYGILTACVIGVYVLVVGYLGALFRTSGNLAISLVAAGCVAVGFQPLRERLQQGVNRLLYGQRDEPYAVLSRLGRRLEDTLAPEAVLPAICRTLTDALKLPYAAILLRQDGGRLVLSAASGTGGAMVAALRVPLIYHNLAVGELLLAPRAPGESFTPADRRLVEDLARQVGVAAHAVRLTAELQASLVELRRSRERLVLAQDGERRRIQRDLHDGLGPTLASMRLRLEACLDMAVGTSAGLVAELERLDELVGQATADIRRLVHDLRPPVLDQLGLLAALRQHVDRFERETAIAMSLHAAEDLKVSPAVEVAVFRVLQEALLNVHKHAAARRVKVRIAQEEGDVVLEVTDDGRGLPEDAHGSGRGAGLRGMRDRADLLGGSLHVARAGTCTRLVLRVPNNPATEDGN
jgi:signal transduction histidine kinase